MADESERTFQQLMDRMEAVVESLETGNLPLEESLALFEEGIRLSRHASARLQAAERQIDELLADGSVVRFDEPGRSGGGAAPAASE